MWGIIGALCFLAFFAFLLGSIISAVRKTGKAKKRILVSLACFAAFVFSIVAANKIDTQETSSRPTDVPPYKILKQEESKAQKTINVATAASTEEDFKKIVQDIKFREKSHRTVWVYLYSDSSDPKDNGYGDLKALAKYANDKEGMFVAETKSLDEIHLEMK